MFEEQSLNILGVEQRDAIQSALAVSGERGILGSAIKRQAKQKAAPEPVGGRTLTTFQVW